ncbi:hypothetical protein FHX15_001735 [Rhizobium sp. BK650]|uniref:hypothetical protein n=1 Tax=Rhizobium sp. BK650 TaxID=2586990 RepID=UPI0017DBA8ED|nr:hypothetical protein [Rhizobium sp. BK650]MBB3656507.1 hypothetical protein [Rhizobium sp. BK650]
MAGLVLHQNGYEQEAPRVDASVVTELEEALAGRIRDKRPVENSKALLREVIHQHQRGEPDYERMAPPLAALVREQFPVIKADLDRMGPLKDLSFKGVTAEGWDVYEVSFDKGNLEWSFILAADGKFSGMFIRPMM